MHQADAVGTAAQHAFTESVLTIPLGYLIFTTSFTSIAVLAKHILVGKLRPGRYPLMAVPIYVGGQQPLLTVRSADGLGPL